MKRLLLVPVLCLSTTLANAGDPCATVLCLGGMLMGGNGGSMYSSSINDYFDIRKKKHGRFSASRTKDARSEYLDKCKSEDNKKNKERINEKWGGSKYSPL